METGSRRHRESDRRPGSDPVSEMRRGGDDPGAPLREADWTRPADPRPAHLGSLGRTAMGRSATDVLPTVSPSETDPRNSLPATSASRPTLDSVSRALEAFGLRRSTARVYCAALRVGPAFPREIIRSARVSRATGYRALERLRRMELLAQARNGPPQINALPLARFLDRSANALLDEADLHREMREVAAEALVRADSVRTPSASGLIGSGDVAAILRDGLALARREILLVPLLRMLTLDTREILHDALEDALHRGVRVRLLIPHQSTHVRLLSDLSLRARADAQLLARVSEPAFFHLYVVDSTHAFRFFVRSTVSDLPSRILGIVTERPPFVQAQEQRYQALWSESPVFERVK